MIATKMRRKRVVERTRVDKKTIDKNKSKVDQTGRNQQHTTKVDLSLFSIKLRDNYSSMKRNAQIDSKNLSHTTPIER